ncbi:acetyltransferase [Achromobacter sp. D10]|uniref:acetyltransferase n=1 Tax=Achromobacter sp. D10 TaxID=3110765 RepID=UPI002B462668|nr:acetyltransferase [Achromobacter sp. D10]MEB3097114.1 acetyltransferase [Achromobacter sp. D10]
MTNKVGVFGFSGWAREIGDIALAIGLSPVYVVRDKGEATGADDRFDIILEADVLNHAEMDFVIGIGDGAIRKKVYDRFKDKLTFRNLIHPHASFGHGQLDRINQSKGVVVCAGVRMTNNIEVGNFSLFNLNATVGHDCIIEEFSAVSPGACVSGNVHIEQAVWIGTGATINQGTPDQKLVIGAGSMIGSGAVVVKSCEPGGTYVGIPAKRIK